MQTEEQLQIDPRKIAAFFDVDGTIVKTTIVHYYTRFRSHLLPPALRPLWFAGFLLKVVYYFFLDRISRSTFNRVFYRNYRGLEVEGLKKLASEEFDTYIRAKIYPAALDCIRTHQARGDRVIFVTGSLDFIIQPLADELAVDDALTVRLNEANGRFTGELTTLPLGEEEKARVIKTYAKKHGIDLSASYAYGDSRADLPMLQCVGHPVAVNPGKSLQRTAVACGWGIREWRLTDA